MDYDVIPDELKQLRAWVAWSYQFRPGETKPWTKVPFRTDGHKARSNEPGTWATFDEARAYVDEYGGTDSNIDGIGVMLAPEFGIVGVDLDDCLDPVTGELAAWADAVVQNLDSYTEVTPSGKGIRVFCFAPLPAGRRRTGPADPRKLEMYNSGRFLTLTGNVYEGRSAMKCRDDAIADVHEFYFPTPAQPERDPDAPPAKATTADDEAVLAVAKRIKNGDKFSLLWAGKPEAAGYADHSGADLAMAGHLAFVVGPDADRIESLMTKSSLARSKWFQRRPLPDGTPSTYLGLTIHKALAGRTEFYTWPSPDATAHYEDRVASLMADLEAMMPADLVEQPAAAPSQTQAQAQTQAEVEAEIKPAQVSGVAAPDAEQDAPPKLRLRRYSAVRANARNNPPQWIVPKWLEGGKLHVFCGAPFAGKSCTLADVIAASCNGAAWADMPIMRVPWILCDNENGDRIIVKRIDRALETTGGDGDVEDLLLPIDPGAVKFPLDQAELTNLLRDYQKVTGRYAGVDRGVIVLDTMRSCFAGHENFEENGNDKMAALLQPLRELAHRSGWAIVVLHHTNKNGGYAGAAAIMSCTDVAWLWDSNKVTMEGVLSMLGTTDDHQMPMRFRFDQAVGRNLYVGEAPEVELAQKQWSEEDATVLEHVPVLTEAEAEEQAVTATKLRELTKKGHAYVHRTLQRLVTAGAVTCREVTRRGGPQLGYYQADKVPLPPGDGHDDPTDMPGPGVHEPV